MRRILIPAAIVIATLGLAGCSSSSDSASTVGRSSGGSSADYSGAVPEPASGGDSGGKTAGGTSASELIQREVVTSGSVSITATDPISAADRAARLVEDAGGRIDARTQTAATKTASGRATLQLRIPAAALTATLDKLKKLGAVDSIKLAADDVTGQGQDLDARIHALSTSVTRLQALEARSTNTKTLIDLETAISDRQGELDSLTAQRKLLSDEVAMSTISLELVSPADAPKTSPANPADAFSAGLAGFGSFFVSLFIGLSYLLPWLVFAAVVALVALVIVRRRRRRTGPGSAAPLAE